MYESCGAHLSVCCACVICAVCVVLMHVCIVCLRVCTCYVMRVLGRCVCVCVRKVDSSLACQTPLHKGLVVLHKPTCAAGM